MCVYSSLMRVACVDLRPVPSARRYERQRAHPGQSFWEIFCVRALGPYCWDLRGCLGEPGLLILFIHIYSHGYKLIIILKHSTISSWRLLVLALLQLSAQWTPFCTMTSRSTFPPEIRSALSQRVSGDNLWIFSTVSSRTRGLSLLISKTPTISKLGQLVRNNAWLSIRAAFTMRTCCVSSCVCLIIVLCREHYCFK